MPARGPIIIIEDDAQDAENITAAIRDVGVTNELKTFHTGATAYEYLRSTSDKPLVILCDVKMGSLDGLSLRQQMLGNKDVLEKAIPFVFLSGVSSPMLVTQAFKLDIQGFFQKPNSYQGLKDFLLTIVAYWQRSLHPSSLAA